MKPWWIVLALPAAALAQEPAPGGPSDEIVVTAVRGMWSLEGKRIRAAQAAFLAGRDRYAPGSRMFFQLYTKGGASAEGLKLTLRKGDEIEDVPIDGERRFGIRPLDSDDWRLTANRTPAQMGVKLWILSPDSSEADRKLGELRLYCRVGWALLKDRFNFVQRTGFEAIGGCDSSRIMIYTGASRPLAAAAIVLPDGTSRPLDIIKDNRYRIPVADKSLPDTARVKLTYR